MKIKHIKKVLIGGMIILVILLSCGKYIRVMLNEHKPVPNQVQHKLINEQLVIDKLHSESKLVVTEGNIHKKYGKQTSIFNTQNEWLYSLGAKKYEVTMNGKYQMGIDLEKIKENDILVSGDRIYIRLPTIELISLTLPYEEMYIENEHGILVNSYSNKQIKNIHRSARKQIISDLSRNNMLNERTLMNTHMVLTDLIQTINKEFEVRFIR